MDFKNLTFYPEFWIDLVVFIMLGVAMVLLSKGVWEWKEKRRLEKEMAEYQQRKDDEAQENT